jgi:ketosteroid isomerase-like protein
MAENTTKKFIEALHKLEAERDLETIVSLFSEDSEVGNVVTDDADIGAREFWANYRDSFDEVRSTFKNEIITDKTSALEWTTTGTAGNGNDFEYDGVSILEIEGDRITRFHAYFDANKLGKQIAPNEKAEAQNNG